MTPSQVGATRRTIGLTVLSLVLVLPGCATGGGGSGGSSGGSGDVITREQIATSSAQNAYNLIREFRPRWVQRSRNQNVTTTTTVADARGGFSANDGDAFPEGSQEFATVFYDGRRYGEIDSLNSLLPEQIEYIEYINARQATTLYGTGYTAGVINVVPRSARDLTPGQ